eukprot:TRINITY_DN2934_c0_g1_i1.p1 TRINITY_DN2934_c0_g1~~TRINITY_DN2934_c0_g1_i1.p1  ORF type:complete len:203 (+),score=46.69 TRINITY_DN2934_c0_g1_i1:2-610(+)
METKGETLASRLRECVSTMLSISREIENELEKLTLKEIEQKDHQKKIDDLLNKHGTTINLNIGGKKFVSSKSTLTCLEGTYFSAMLSSDHWRPNSEGEYFIDRNPKYFRRVLEYLRTGKLDLEGLSERRKEKLMIELDYYQIPEPTKIAQQYEGWKWDIKNKGRRIILSNDDRTACGDTEYTAAVAGNKPSVSYTHLTLPTT